MKFPALYVLNVLGNLITSLCDNILYQNQELGLIYIGYNNLKDLPDFSSIKQPERALEITLDNNPYHCNCELSLAIREFVTKQQNFKETQKHV